MTGSLSSILLAWKRAKVGRYFLVRAARFGEGGGATRARAVASYFPGAIVVRPRARSSAGERLLHTQEVTGSIPVAPTPSDVSSMVPTRLENFHWTDRRRTL